MLAETAERIAGLLAGASTELNRMGALLRDGSPWDRSGSVAADRPTGPPGQPAAHSGPAYTIQGPHAPPWAGSYPGYIAAPPPPAGPVQPPLSERFSHWASKEGAGTRLLAWVGGAVTLLGIVFLLVLAIQQGWLGPGVRVLGGAGLGACLLACAAWVDRQSPEAGRAAAFALVATGIATLYLDVLASTALYHFLVTPAGLLAALALAAGGLWWADRWSSQVLAVGVVLGCALCAPMLFGSVLASRSGTALLTAFLVVLEIGATPVQLRRTWSLLAAASAFPAVLSATVAGIQAEWNVADPWPAAAAAGVVAISGTVLSVVTGRRRPQDPVAVTLLLSSAAPALLAAAALGRWQELGMALAVAAMYLVVWLAKKYVPSWLRIAAGGACALAVFQASVLTVHGHGRSITLLGEAAVLAWVAMRVRGTRMLLTAAIYGLVGAILVLVDVPPRLFVRFPASPYFVDDTAQVGSMWWGALAFLCLGSTSGLFQWAAIRLKPLIGPSARPMLLGVGTTIGMLYGGAGLVLTLCLLADPSKPGFLVGQVLITVSWMSVALVLLLRGIRSISPRVAGFALVAVALSKLVLFDLAALTGLARVTAFLGAGLVLLAGGTTYARLLSRTRSTPVEDPVP